MGRKNLQLTIDGVGVDLTKARFADTFEVADRDVPYLAFDEEVVYLVVARVSTPRFAETKDGEVSRVNVLKVREARLVRDEDFKFKLLEKIGFDHRPQPSLFDDTGPDDKVEEAPEPVVRLLPDNPDGRSVWDSDDLDQLDEIEVQQEEVFIPNFTVKDGVEVEQTDEPDEIDEEMQAWLSKMKELSDDEEGMYEATEGWKDEGVAPSTSRSQVVGRAQGAETRDPVLAGFLGV